MTLSLSFSISVFAQDSSPTQALSQVPSQTQALTLREAISRTLASNPQFREYALRAQALDGELYTADLDPAFRLSGEVENVIGTGDLNWFQGSELTLALSRVVELGDKRGARTDIVGRRQALLIAQRQVLELELLAETTRRFIALAAVQQQAELLTRSTALAIATQASVSQRVAVGRAPQTELARANAALRLAQLAEETMQYDIDIARAGLSSLWGQLTPDFNAVSANLLQLEATPPIEGLLGTLEDNPAILVFADEARLKQAELNEAQSRRHADIELGAGVRYLAELNDTAFTVQGSIPLGSNARASGAIATAQANLLLVEAEREVALLRMSALLTSLNLQRQQAANEFVVINDSILPELTDAMNETRDAFDNGRLSYVDLSAAQKELLDSEFTLIEAATRVHLLTAEIERLSGRGFTQFSNGVTP